MHYELLRAPAVAPLRRAPGYDGGVLLPELRALHDSDRPRHRLELGLPEDRLAQGVPQRESAAIHTQVAVEAKLQCKTLQRKQTVYDLP